MEKMYPVGQTSILPPFPRRKAKSVSIAVELAHRTMTRTSLRVTAFSSKVRNLNEYYQHVTSSQQLPSGLNIVNTLRYFQQTLLGILRETQSTSLAPFMRLKSEPSRSTLFPTLNYAGLYNALNNIIDIYPLVTTGQLALGNAILNTVQCLYLFLEKEQAEQLPYNLACLLSIYPSELYPDVLRLLCNVLLPFTLLDETANTYVASSLPAIMMLDILAVIAYGTSESRIPATNLLFHYWPLSKADFLNRRSTGYKIHAWAPTRCQQRNCSSGDENLSVKKCYCPVYCAEYGDIAPPLFLCSQCSKEVPDTVKSSLCPYFQPLSTLVNICQNKECTSSNRLAVATCFSEECVRLNNYIPSRLCERCHQQRHPASHTFVDGIPPAWDCDSKTFTDMICAIVSLLKETSVMLEEMEAEKIPKWLQKIENVDEEKMELSDDRRMLSRLGIRMLVRFCPPTKEAPDETIGRLLAAVFLWFDTTALLPSGKGRNSFIIRLRNLYATDSIGASMEEVKSEFVNTWLRQVIDCHYEVFLQCLLPEPPIYARVGGVWDKLSKKTDQLKESLGKILALIPYDLICFETWERIMPQWFAVMSSEVPEADLIDLKVLLSKIFEVDLCSLPFPSEKIYHFIEVRLQSSNLQEQESALGWLQLLTDVDIVIPLPILLSLMKTAALNVLQLEPVFPTPSAKAEEVEADNCESEERGSIILPETSPTHRQSVFCFNDNTNVVMFIIMLDILMRQMELSEFQRNQGTKTDEAQIVLSVMSQIVRCPWYGVHYCKNAECDEYADCLFCRDSTVFFQLAVELVQLLSPKPGTVPSESPSIRRKSDFRSQPSLDSRRMSTKVGDDELLRPDQPVHAIIRKKPSLMPLGRSSGVNAANCSVVVEEYPDEFVGILPIEEPEVVTAEAVTIPESEAVDCKVVTASLMDATNPTASNSFGTADTGDGFLYTRQGKFRIRFEELPAELQLIHALMTTIEKHPDPDVKYYMLLMVKTLCLNCCALKNVQFEYRGFLIWAQENILISKFWKLLQSQYSQISEVCTCLIFHCLSLPGGADVFWSVVSADFTSNDFSTRFAAVEKVTVLSWFIDQTIIKSCLIIQGAVANAFIFLISSVRDCDTALAQRALLSLQTIKASSLRCLCLALEHQFDAVVEDRSLIMHQFLTLSSILPDALVLNWDFFQSRFEVLSSEMQSHLARVGKLSIAGDLSLADLGGSKRRPSLSQQLIERGGQLRSIYRHLLETLSEQRKADEIDRFKHRDSTKGEAKQQQSEEAVNDEQCAADLKDPSKVLERMGNLSRTSKLPLESMPDVDNKEQCMKESSRLVVALFMKFLSNPCTAFINADEKALAKKQSSVLRHLNLLLGYSIQERSFAMPPSRLRASPIANVFLYNLPKVLDGNVFFARQILPIASSLLLYLPSSDAKAASERGSSSTLWLLEPLARHSWLWSLLLILYKYQFDQPPINETVLSLVEVVIGTLNSQVHSCSKVQMTISSPSFRSAVIRREVLYLNMYVDSSAAASCESLSTEWEELSEVPTSATDGSKFHGGSPLGSSGVFPRKRKPIPKRQLTFDEREEHVLEEDADHLNSAERSLHDEADVHTPFNIETPLEDSEMVGSMKQSLSLRRGKTDDANIEISKGAEATVSSVAPLTVPSAVQPQSCAVQDANGPVHPNSVTLKPTVKTPENAEVKLTSQKETPPRNSKTVPAARASIEKTAPSLASALNKPYLTGRSRTGDSVIQCRCFNCNAVLEVCDEETISLGIVCLSTFIHRDPAMAAPYLLKMLVTVFRIANHVFHPWQESRSTVSLFGVRWKNLFPFSHIFVPSNCRSVARQFVRIVLHQLAPNRLFASLFESDIMEPQFFKTIASCLADFQELNSVQVIQHLMEDLQDSPPTNTVCVLANLSEYMRYVPYDTFLPNWTIVVGCFDSFFRSLMSEVSDIGLYVPHLLNILNNLFRVSNFSSIRDRDKYTLTRCCLSEFCQALKFKHTLNDNNYMTIIKLILYDFGEPVDCDLDRMLYPTAAVECARPFLMDFIEFLQDYHVLNRMKNVARESGGLSQDTLGGDLKIGLAKYVAHEICRSISRDSRAIYRYLPWLSSPPAVTQLGASEFVDCVGRVRLLSWILIGSLSCSASAFSMAIPIDCSHRISDYIQFVLAGFAELSNQSVLNMSALFHAFHLCQLWTIYCEETLLHSCNSSSREEAIASVMDFWARITPAILQLLSHSKVLADMVNLHFLNAVEGLLEADSVVLTRLYAMWYPILAAYHSNIPSHLMVRLDFFENSVQSAAGRDLSPWLKKIGFKIGQVELQSSAATQFYSV
ncbi:hypothetical protein M514_08994 [Trichuris suis]|uniref:Uncoordinated protein 79 n=1 Tax=Trichuris suis TaxID=68888 RepID=A0A085NKN8_9BILA|nr:hypothetical protein M514_08994 [Trichuris suis]